ncbi:AMP-binding protein [Neorhodopirellula pilleata]|uniref:AMP-binding protein n=1 Tax=Neorhodopirellula pilleata TaxID=2714738 RepID=UPI001E476655|nr:AMP-binding protein [Neorhodopirellula pilleata]
MTRSSSSNAGQSQLTDGRWGDGTTLVDILSSRSETCPERIAFRFLEDESDSTTISYFALDRAARRIAAGLQQQVEPGSSVALVFPPGLDFIKSFLGCLYAGVLAIPATYPKPKRPSARLSAIVEDARPSAVLATRRVVDLIGDSAVSNQLGDPTWLSSDDLEANPHSNWKKQNVQPSDLAFLQYTSGSTKDPRGVMVSHGNILQNLEMIRQGFQLSHHVGQVGVCWLPAYHDMGLIGGILESLYIGGTTVLMSPLAFLQRPSRWLRAISDHRAVVSGGPNFAFELCMRKIKPEELEGVDLSSWEVAFSGAEPIRATTMRRFAQTYGRYGFSKSAFYPCYGLAEATLLVTGGNGPGEIATCTVDAVELQKNGRAVDAKPTHSSDGQPPSESTASSIEFVDCGRAPMDEEVLVVDPETCLPCHDNQVGEIWVRGGNVAQGYRNRPVDNEAIFSARLADGRPDAFLRTGDLGFLRKGSLFVTGRRNELIIIRGRNHYPHDLEATVQSGSPHLIPGGGSAFLIDRGGDDHLVLVQEVDRGSKQEDWQQIIPEIRRSVTAEHDVFVHEVILIRMGTLPRTTSGKVRYSEVKQQYTQGELAIVHQWSVGQSVNSSAAFADAATGDANRHDRDGVSSVPSAEDIEAASMNDLMRRLAATPPGDQEAIAEELEMFLTQWLIYTSGTNDQDFDPDRPFAEYGLDSLSSMELIAQLEKNLKLKLSPTIAWTYPNPSSLASHLAELHRQQWESESVPSMDAASEPQGTTENMDDEMNDDLNQLLAKLEEMPDDEVAEILAAQEQMEHLQ